MKPENIARQIVAEDGWIHIDFDALRARIAAEIRAERQQRDELLGVLRLILAEPHGCPFCDSGKLRNPAKGHADECGFGKAKAIIKQLDK